MNVKKSICIVAILLSSIFVACSRTNTTEADISFHGKWGGAVVISGTEDYWTINIDTVENTVTISSTALAVDFMPVDWEIENGTIIISMNDEANRMVVTLSISENNEELEGNFAQYGLINNVNLSRTSDRPETGLFSINGQPPVSYEDRIQDLRDFAEFSDDEETIPFFYDLGRRDLYTDLIERFDLDTLTAGYSDVRLMVVLLNWVCDNFLHDGNSGMPDERNAYALINYLDNNPDGGNCRILAILLAEVLRLYGIEAKHITLHPKEVNGIVVHVVTHAYSRELGKWIMLDPTFRVLLQDTDGIFLDIPALRAVIADGGEFFPYGNAGRNNQPFNEESYRNFMADYLFRFSSGTNFTFGSEDGIMGNQYNMLAPIGYIDDPDITTHSARAFWSVPAR